MATILRRVTNTLHHFLSQIDRNQQLGRALGAAMHHYLCFLQALAPIRRRTIGAVRIPGSWTIFQDVIGPRSVASDRTGPTPTDALSDTIDSALIPHNETADRHSLARPHHGQISQCRG